MEVPLGHGPQVQVAQLEEEGAVLEGPDSSHQLGTASLLRLFWGRFELLEWVQD